MPAQGRVRYARRTLATVRPGKESEFLSLLKKRVYPQVSKEKGLRRIYLLRDVRKPTEFISLTFWDTKKDADEYGRVRFEDYQAIVAEKLQEKLAVSEFKVEYHAISPSLPPPTRSRKGPAH